MQKEDHLLKLLLLFLLLFFVIDSLNLQSIQLELVVVFKS